MADTDPFEEARYEQTLVSVGIKARPRRDAAVKALLDAGYGASEIAAAIGVVEGTIRQIRRKPDKSDKSTHRGESR